MKRIPVADQDRRSIADWFTTWGELVANVDFKRARDIYVDDVIAFGSLGKMLTTRERRERRIQHLPGFPLLIDRVTAVLLPIDD